MLTFSFFFLISFFTVSLSPAYAYESDQYETLGIELKDATEVLNTLIQAEIEEVVQLWQGRERDDLELAFDISSRFSRRQLEVWGIDSSHIESYSSGHNSVYNNVSPWFAPIQYSKGLAPTVSVNGVHLGLDKLTHFFGVGALYLHVAKQYDDSDEGKRAAINFGEKAERTYWGSMTTSVYSNADMVANYEGFRFLRGLFTDNTVSGKPALLVWDDNGPRVQRPFDIRDYVNDYWNEVYNPNSFASTISSQITESLEAFCDRKSASGLSTSYVSANDGQLSLHYRDKGVRSDRTNYLLPKICKDFYDTSSQEKENHDARHKEKPQNYSSLPINVLGLKTELKKVQQTIISTLCRRQIHNASEEHDLLLKTYRRISSGVWAALEKQIKLNDSIALSSVNLHKVALHKATLDKSKIHKFKLEKLKLQKAPKEDVSANSLGDNSLAIKHHPTRNSATKSQCYILDVEDEDAIIRKGVTLQMRLCLVQNDDGSWHKKKQYIVSFENKIQKFIQDLDPIMLNLFDAEFTHYSSNSLDYFSWDHRVGYVYRTISPLCRWY